MTSGGVSRPTVFFVLGILPGIWIGTQLYQSDRPGDQWVGCWSDESGEHASLARIEDALRRIQSSSEATYNKVKRLKPFNGCESLTSKVKQIIEEEIDGLLMTMHSDTEAFENSSDEVDSFAVVYSLVSEAAARGVWTNEDDDMLKRLLPALTSEEQAELDQLIFPLVVNGTIVVEGYENIISYSQ